MSICDEIYRDCHYKNEDGTRMLIAFEKHKRCLLPTLNPFCKDLDCRLKTNCGVQTKKRAREQTIRRKNKQ